MVKENPISEYSFPKSTVNVITLTSEMINYLTCPQNLNYLNEFVPALYNATTGEI